MKDSFILFTEIKETVDIMDDAQAGALFKMILNYESGEEDSFAGLKGTPADYAEAVIAFTFIRRQLDRNEQKYHETAGKRSEAGKKGAEKRWQNMASDSKVMANDSKDMASDSKEEIADSKPVASDALNVNVNDNDNVKEKVKREKRFVPPTIDEVRAYCQERGNDVFPEAFMAHYESVGWKVGNKPMKDWRAAVRTWEANQKTRISARMGEKKPNSFFGFQQNRYSAEDFAALEE